MGLRVDGKVVLVSGGSRGMGASHARVLAASGASVVIGDVLAEEGQLVAKEIGEQAAFVELDVTREADWARAVDATVERFGGLDVLVNNAGVAPPLTAIVDLSLDEYRRVTEVNQTGVFLGMRAAIPALARRGSGSIINISSVAGRIGSALSLPYTASKFAVRGMTKVAAAELAPFGIRVNSVHPGYIRTPMLEVPGVDLAAMAQGTVPLDRVADPAEVSQVVFFLASEASSYCTGAEFVVDGGLTAALTNPALSAIATEAIRSHI